MTNCKAESSDAGLMHVQYGQSESENWLGPINLTATEVQVFYDHPGQLLIDSNKEFPHYVTSLADHYDALISDRPYRAGLPRETVSGFIKEGFGTKFDPKVVEAFLEVMAQEDREAVSS